MTFITLELLSDLGHPLYSVPLSFRYKRKITDTKPLTDNHLIQFYPYNSATYVTEPSAPLPRNTKKG